jgi:protein arginine kinase
MAFSLDPKRFAQHIGTWLAAAARVRRGRLLPRAPGAQHRGVSLRAALEDDKARELASRLREVLIEQRIDGETIWVGMEEAPSIVKLLLRERYLVSRDLAPTDPRFAAAPGARRWRFGENETLADDGERGGPPAPAEPVAGLLAATRAFERVRALDRALEREVAFAVSPDFGYLTGCPTNVGTGLRASVMMHLPAPRHGAQRAREGSSWPPSARAWRCAACTARAAARPATSTRSRTRSRWAPRRRS